MATPYQPVDRDEKVEAIRQHLAMSPDDSPTKVITALARLGITASPSLVQEVQEELAIESSAHDDAAPTTSRSHDAHPQTRRDHALNDKVQMDDMAAVQQFVHSLGGIDRARRALEEWARLQK